MSLSDTLFAVAGFFADAAQWLNDQGSEFEDQGGALAFVAVLCYNLSILCSHIAQTWLDGVDAALEIESLLADLSDASGVKGILDAFLAHLPGIADEMIEWVREALYNIFGVDLLGLFTGDNWFGWSIQDWFGMLAWFFSDPGAFLKWCIATKVSFSGGPGNLFSILLYDPDEWLEIVLGDYLGIDLDWLEDPWGELLDRILAFGEAAFQARKQAVIDFGEHVLRLVIEGVW